MFSNILSKRPPECKALRGRKSAAGLRVADAPLGSFLKSTKRPLRILHAPVDRFRRRRPTLKCQNGTADSDHRAFRELRQIPVAHGGSRRRDCATIENNSSHVWLLR